MQNHRTSNGWLSSVVTIEMAQLTQPMDLVRLTGKWVFPVMASNTHPHLFYEVILQGGLGAFFNRNPPTCKIAELNINGWWTLTYLSNHLLNITIKADTSLPAT